MTNTLSLVRDEPEEVLELFLEGSGRIRLPGDVETYLHAPYAGWSEAGLRIATVLPPEIVAGKRRVSLGPDGVTFVDGKPTWILEDIPPEPRRMVPKSVVTQRVIDAGMIDQAMAALQSDWAKFARWVAPDQPAVYFDDADTVVMIEALGLDPEQILAPE